MNKNLREEVHELYDRGDKLREMTQQDDANGQPGPQRTGRSSQLMSRNLLLFLGIGFVIYGLIAIAVRITSGGFTAPRSPAAGVISSSQTVNSCEAALKSLDQVEVTETENPSQGLSADEAEDIADNYLHQFLKMSRDTYPVLLGGPTLVEVQLPNGSLHQAWARVWIPELNPEKDSDSQTSKGVASHVLYLSSTTGEPLLLVQNLTIEDPLLAGCNETVVSELVERLEQGPQLAVGWLLNLGLLIMGTVILAFWQRRGW